MRRVGEEVESLDVRLASLSRVEAALRLRLGQVLEALSRGGCFELGFSSLSAYALERCDRSVRWVEAARCLARRAESLPALRRALAFGKVSWSMGELLARVARPDDEGWWLEVAAKQTVRQVRGLVSGAIARGREAGGGVACDEIGEGGGDEGEETCTLTQTVDVEDAWLFEATRALLDQLGVRGSDAQCEALLAEAQSTLLAVLPEGTFDGASWEWQGSAQQLWLRELGRWRDRKEARCEARLRKSLSKGLEAEVVPSVVALAAAGGMATLWRERENVLDGHVRDLANALARHDLELSRALLRFHRIGGWRRLGYASETQYARERLGMSSSSLLARRALAVRLETLPHVSAALGAAQIGVEAAFQVVRVATPRTEAAWVERARRRTVKHLREEVAAARVAVRVSGEADCPPPVDAELDAFHELERAVVSGRAGLGKKPDHGGPGAARPAEPASAERRAWFEMLGSLAQWLESGLQMSAGGSPASRSSAGRVALRLRMSRATYAWWRGLEDRARRWLPGGMSWVRVLCLSTWQAWKHLFGVDVAYGRIYIRDRYRCLSPVCSRRDVTPHHLRFRSAGGGDEDDNVATICSWCHLHGVHGGRIRAVGTAKNIRWELGQPGSPCLIVQGRERVPMCRIGSHIAA